LNGPNFPPLASQAMPLADWPTLLCGSRHAGGMNWGIFSASK
jgi:hypothetical protein